MKIGFMRAILACLTLAAFAATAHAQVYYGVVGDGTHVQFGPQDANGDYLGITSESYDYSYAPDYDGLAIFPAGGAAPSGYEGYMLMAFNPYTGEMWTDIPVEHQATNPASEGTYIGHSPATPLSGPSGLPDDPATPDVDESLVWSDYLSNNTSSATGLTQDCIYIGVEYHPAGDGVNVGLGNYVYASPDGGILSYYSSWDPVGDNGREDYDMQVGEEVRAWAENEEGAPNGHWETIYDPYTGQVIDEVWTSPALEFGDPSDPDAAVWGLTYWYDSLGWRGRSGSGDAFYGFEMDGIKGWMRLKFTGFVSGVRVMEYYFDYSGGLRGDFDGDGDIDADDIDILMANLGGDPGEFDLTDDGVVDQDDVDEWVFNIVPIGENIGTVYGDFNLDGEVNAGDLALLATNYGLVGTWGWATGDGNGDGNVDAGDLAMLATNYGTVVHTVPEPASAALLLTGVMALIRRRK